MRAHSPFTDAIAAVMADPEARGRHPEGLTAGEVLDEIRLKNPDAFPLCTWLDVHDEMEFLYGEPTGRKS